MAENLPMTPQPVNELVAEAFAALIQNKPSFIGGRMNRIVTKMMGTVMSRAKASAFWGNKMQEMVHLK